MRKIFFPFAVGATLALTACHWGRTGGGSDGDSLSYTAIIYEDSVNEGGYVAYQQINVDYPVADDASVLADSVREWLKQELSQCCYPAVGEDIPKAPDYTGDMRDGEAVVRHYAASGTKEMGKALAPDEDGFVPFGYGNDYNAGVTYQTDKFLTYSTGWGIYTGGAHGMYISELVTFDRADGRRMGWNLVDTLEARKVLMKCLREGIEEYFNQDADPNTEHQSLRDVLFKADFNPELPDDELLDLPGTPPALTADGVSFVYQQYEIAAYAYGLPSCTVPYEKAKAFLTAEGKRLAGL